MKRLFEHFFKEEYEQTKDELHLLIALIAVPVIVMVALLGAWILFYT